MRIGETARLLGLSPDTLRYYERIGLLSGIGRDSSGVRIYSRQHVSQLRFIRRAQRMGFSLEDIRHLLQFRKNPVGARNEVKKLAREKLAEIEAHLEDLQTLHHELELLIGLCGQDPAGCPILQALEQGSGSSVS